MTQKFPIGTRVVVKKNLTLRGRVLDYRGGVEKLILPRYDVVIEGEQFTREYIEQDLVLESNLTIKPFQNHVYVSKQEVLDIFKKHLTGHPTTWRDVQKLVEEITAL